jgi:hypothetical protein
VAFLLSSFDAGKCALMFLRCLDCCYTQPSIQFAPRPMSPDEIAHRIFQLAMRQSEYTWMYLDYSHSLWHPAINGSSICLSPSANNESFFQSWESLTWVRNPVRHTRLPRECKTGISQVQPPNAIRACLSVQERVCFSQTLPDDRQTSIDSRDA